MAEEERDKRIEERKEQEKAERLDRAIDEFLMKGEHPEELDLEDEELLGLSAEMAQLFSPVESDPSFKESLKRDLISTPEEVPARGFTRITAEPPRRSLWERLFGVRPMLSFASLAAALLILAAGFYAFEEINNPSQPSSPQVATQPNTGASSPESSQATAQPMLGTGPTQASPASGGTSGVMSTAPTGTAERGAQETPAPTVTPAAPVQVAAYGPLPELSPVAMGKGGGGAAGTATQGSATEEPPAFVKKVETASGMPALPAQAPVYLLKQPNLDPAYTDQVAKKLGPAFGFSTPPRAEPVTQGEAGDPSIPTHTDYFWQEGDRSLQYMPVSGFVAYQDVSWYTAANGGTPPPIKRPVKDEQEAISVATDFARSAGALSEEYQVSASEEPNGAFWTVDFQRTIDGRVVTGSDTRVTIGDELKVTGLTSQIRPVESSSPYPLKSLDQAIRDIESGKVLMWQNIMIPPGNAQNDTAQLTGVSIVYYEDFPGHPQRYLQPVYAFEGTVTYNGKTQPFTVYVPAVSDQYIAK